MGYTVRTIIIDGISEDKNLITKTGDLRLYWTNSRQWLLFTKGDVFVAAWKGNSIYKCFRKLWDNTYYTQYTPKEWKVEVKRIANTIKKTIKSKEAGQPVSLINQEMATFMFLVDWPVHRSDGKYYTGEEE